MRLKRTPGGLAAALFSRAAPGRSGLRRADAGRPALWRGCALSWPIPPSSKSGLSATCSGWQKMQRQRDRAAEVQRRMRALEKQFTAAYDKLVPGETPALAAARLQERVQTFADRSGLTLVTTQVMRDRIARLPAQDAGANDVSGRHTGGCGFSGSGWNTKTGCCRCPVWISGPPSAAADAVGRPPVRR